MEVVKSEQKQFECERCLRCFSQKIVLQKHLQRKNKCEMVYKCKECQKTFYDKSTLNRHCKSDGHKQVVASMSVVAINNSGPINNNSHNKILNINVYSDTDYSGITENDFVDLNDRITTPVVLIARTLKKIHFNDKKTENHNVYINNIRTKVVKVYEKDGWCDKDNTFIYGIIVDIIDYLVDRCSELCPEKEDRLCDLTSDIRTKIKTQSYDNKGVREVYGAVCLVLYERKQFIKESIRKALSMLGENAVNEELVNSFKF